jgi:hypothetical protein
MSASSPPASPSLVSLVSPVGSALSLPPPVEPSAESSFPLLSPSVSLPLSFDADASPVPSVPPLSCPSGSSRS